jgi:hypothetical protein
MQSKATEDIRENQAFDLDISLAKVYTKEIAVQKYFVAPPSETNDEGIGVHVNENGEIVACNLNLEHQELQSYESAIITITKLDTENGVFTAVPVVIVDPQAEEPATIDIAEGTYSVDIMLLREERYAGEMTIKAHSQSLEVVSTTGTETITYPDEDLLLPQTFTGGAVFEWTVSARDVESREKIIFSVFDEGPPEKVEQVSAALQHREACSELERAFIEPAFE